MTAYCRQADGFIFVASQRNTTLFCQTVESWPFWQLAPAPGSNCPL